MENQKTDITQMSFVELKAAAYDQKMLIERCNENLKVIHNQMSIVAEREAQSSTDGE